MRRGDLFLGFLLVVLGSLFLLKTAGYLQGDVMGWFWPLFIVGAGAWVLLEALAPGAPTRPLKTFSVPLQDAREAALVIEHGVGRMTVGSGASAGDFMSGTEAAGMDQSIRRSGERLEVTVQAGPSFVPFIGPAGGIWAYRLNPDVPTSLAVHAGASRLDVDLTDLRVKHFAFEGGASRLNLTLPARVESVLVEIMAGASGIDVRVPDGVGLRLRTEAVGTLDVDQARFPRREPGQYQSIDFDSTQYRADVRIEGGAASIHVH